MSNKVLQAIIPVALSIASSGAFAAHLEEVVVTAQRRAESLQTTPVSVTAFTADTLETRQMTGMADLTARVPNLGIYPVPGFTNGARVYIRGVGEDVPTPTNDGAVGIYVDGVFYARSLGILFDFIDVSQIEVLRGPQGTLYGRNTSGGAVKITTMDPGEELAGQLELTLGNYNRQQVRAIIGGPLTGAVKGQLSFLYEEHDGTSTNTTLGRDVGRKDTWSARGKLLWDASDSLKFVLAGDFTDDNSDVGVNTSAFSGRPPDLHVTTAGVDPKQNLENYGTSLTGTWENGPYTLTSITAYRKLETDGTLDNDAEAPLILQFFADADQEQVSEEITLSTDFGRLKGILGAYWFSEDNTYDTILSLGSRSNPAAAATVIPEATAQGTDSWALFGQLSYDITDTVTATAGLRYTDDKKDFSNGYPSLSRLWVADKSWSATTPRFSIDWRATETWMLFASYAEGYKAGGFNRSSNPVVALTPYDEETVKTVEVGLKSQFADNRVRMNITYFHNDYKDLQLSVFDPATNVSRRFNAAAATTSGIEIEMDALLTDDLNAYVSIGYLDARYDEFYDRVDGVLTDVSYRKLKGAPEWTGAAGFSWKVPLRIRGSLHLNGDYSYRSEMMNDVANTPIITTGVVALTNAALVWTSDSNNWSASLFGKNLSDKEYVAGGLYIPNLATALYPSEPRTYGLSVRYKF